MLSAWRNLENPDAKQLLWNYKKQYTIQTMNRTFRHRCASVPWCIRPMQAVNTNISACKIWHFKNVSNTTYRVWGICGEIRYGYGERRLVTCNAPASSGFKTKVECANERGFVLYHLMWFLATINSCSVPHLQQLQRNKHKKTNWSHWLGIITDIIEFFPESDNRILL